MNWVDWLILLLKWFWIVCVCILASCLARVASGKRELLCTLLFAFRAIWKTQLSSFIHVWPAFPSDLILFVCPVIFPTSMSLYVFLFVCVCVALMQDLTMKLSLIQSVGLIAKAISECVKKQGYIFSRKQELITVMLVSRRRNFKRFNSQLFADSDGNCFLISPPCCVHPSRPGQDFIKAESADSLRTPVRHLVMTTCANLMYPSLKYTKICWTANFFSQPVNKWIWNLISSTYTSPNMKLPKF